MSRRTLAPLYHCRGSVPGDGTEIGRLGEERDGGTGQEQEDLDHFAERFAEDGTHTVSPRDVKKGRCGVESSDKYRPPRRNGGETKDHGRGDGGNCAHGGTEAVQDRLMSYQMAARVCFVWRTPPGSGIGSVLDQR